MKTSTALLLSLAATTPLAATAATASPVAPFTATYKVLRKGSPLGTSTLSLRRNDDGSWTYSSSLEAESGLAAVLGGSLEESSRFEFTDDRARALAYDYRMHTSFKSRELHMRMDWKDGRVTVDDGKGTYRYDTEPGLVERHLLVLALGRAAARGDTDITLTVGGKKHAKAQTYRVTGKQRLDVPAGSVQAIHIERTHDDKGYQVWFAPEKYGTAPVKLSQESGGDITLLLKSYKTL